MSPRPYTFESSFLLSDSERSSRKERRGDMQHGFKPMTLQRRCVRWGKPVSCNVLFFHRVTDVEIKRAWAEWHAPATRSCAGRQTSVQWHPRHECLVGAHSGDRGCHCSLWSQSSWVNLADREYRCIYSQMFRHLSGSLVQRNIQQCKSSNTLCSLIDSSLDIL